MGADDFNFNDMNFDNMPKVKVREILEFLILLIYLEQLQLKKTKELINEKLRGICESEIRKYSVQEVVSINESINRLLKILKKHEDLLESKMSLVLCILEKCSSVKE